MTNQKYALLDVVKNKDKLIPFDHLDEESFKPAILELIAKVKETTNGITESKSAPSWNNIIDRLDDAEENLNFGWTIISHLNSVKDTPELRKIVNELLPSISELYSWLGQNEELYAKYKELRGSEAGKQLNKTRQRILERQITGFVLSGAELSKENKKKLSAINEESSQLSQEFSENLLDCTNDFSLYLPEGTKQLEGVPESEKQLFKQQAQKEGKEGYKITLHMPNYLPIMQYAADRDLREQLYHAYSTRASEFSPAGKDNAPIIERLLELRSQEAGLLGYKNFAEVSLVMKMADSPEEVIKFLRELASKAKPAAKKDMEELLKFAKEDLKLEDPKAWDLTYASERLREKKYSYSDQEVKQYFTEPTVFKGLFGLVEKLFGIQVEETKAPVWAPEVKYFVIKDKAGKEIASFYADLYAREGKRGGAWMNDQRSRREVDGKIQTPIAYLVCNFSAPVGDKPALLTLNDVETLFHEFGHGLHHMLTKQTDLSVSGIADVEWDAVEMPSQFMENFVWNWDIIQSLTSHVDTGKPMPKELFDKIVAAKNFEAGMANVRQIEFALFDMLLHCDYDPKTCTVQELLDAVRKEVAVVFPPKYNRFANSFSHIFAGGYAAGYYSYKWAEVLSADAFSLFEEKGIFNSEVGQKWLTEVLAVGGSRPAKESFKAFRGRDPSPDALLRSYGLLDR
ncbi:M3 family metallopeptidase [uncultured Turicimonas sp.]|uniref:M3 family metallopeptidase n=1 Tax=uncultured Turicimonas sp. TaxID=1918607 RepID=UPI0028048755|nr:M3 family metallopeptidase [uncultured Turicimonas sp.]